MFPDLPFFILLTIETLPGNRVVVVGSALIRLTIQMHAVAISSMRDQIGSTELPAGESFFHILFGQGKRELTADGFAKRQPALAIYLGFVFEDVLIILGS